MNTIAVIASRDTKSAELDFVSDLITGLGMRAMVIDVSTSEAHTSRDDVTREAVALAAGVPWRALAGEPKDVLLSTMGAGASAKLAQLHASRRIDGVLGLGGLQNTTIASQAMRALPIGFPKLIVSTITSGTRTFAPIVGTKDITVMPSITDLAGLNIISEAVLTNAVSAMIGMVRDGRREIGHSTRPIVGTTLMGATNDGVVEAARLLESQGQPVACFHSTGVGGQALEELIADGTIKGAMDLTLHEIVYEYFGGGFGAGTASRLSAGARAGIPMVVSPGGIDFICQWRGSLFEDVDERKMVWHNAQLAHVKLKPGEARAIARLVVERLNEATGPVHVHFPTQGLRTLAKKGEPLHDPEVDAAVLEEFQTGLRPDIVLELIDASIVDPEFSRTAADAMLALMGATAPVP